MGPIQMEQTLRVVELNSYKQWSWVSGTWSRGFGRWSSGSCWPCWCCCLCTVPISSLRWMLLPDIWQILRVVGCGHAAYINIGSDSFYLRLSRPGTWGNGTPYAISSPNLRACVGLPVGSWHCWLMWLSVIDNRAICKQLHGWVQANRDVIVNLISYEDGQDRSAKCQTIPSMPSPKNVVGFDHGFPCHVKNMARGTQ